MLVQGVEPFDQPAGRLANRDHRGLVLVRGLGAPGALFVVASAGLGIDVDLLRVELARLATSLGQYGCIWLDAQARRIGLRTFEAGPPPLARPGHPHVEVESTSDGLQSVLWIVGEAPLADDLATLAADGVSRAIVDELGGKLRTLGATRSFAIGNRLGQWFVTSSVSTGSVQQLSALAEALGITPYQVAMLGQLHTELDANGCTVTLACTQDAIAPELVITYSGVAWPTAITVTNRLLRTDPSRAYGVFAGALQADVASYLELTFRSTPSSRVRVAFEYESGVVS